MLPLDLHVLGLPLAFILSQDQTLRCCLSVIQILQFCFVLRRNILWCPDAHFIRCWFKRNFCNMIPEYRNPKLTSLYYFRLDAILSIFSWFAIPVGVAKCFAKVKPIFQLCKSKSLFLKTFSFCNEQSSSLGCYQDRCPSFAGAKILTFHNTNQIFLPLFSQKFYIPHKNTSKTIT